MHLGVKDASGKSLTSLPDYTNTKYVFGVKIYTHRPKMPDKETVYITGRPTPQELKLTVGVSCCSGSSYSYSNFLNLVASSLLHDSSP